MSCERRERQKFVNSTNCKQQFGNLHWHTLLVELQPRCKLFDDLRWWLSEFLDILHEFHQARKIILKYTFFWFRESNKNIRVSNQCMHAKRASTNKHQQR